MTTDKTVHVDQSRDIGKKILDSMIGKKVEDYSFKGADQSDTWHKNFYKIYDESVL